SRVRSALRHDATSGGMTGASFPDSMSGPSRQPGFRSAYTTGGGMPSVVGFLSVTQRYAYQDHDSQRYYLTHSYTRRLPKPAVGRPVTPIPRAGGRSGSSCSGGR